MTNKLYNEEAIRSIADAIREKNGSSESYRVKEMAAAISTIPTGAQAKDVEWHQCPEAVRKFVTEAVYSPDDYSTSEIAEYAPTTPIESNYKPVGVEIDGKAFFNQPPLEKTQFQTDSEYGTLMPLDHVRYINTPYAPNVRDIGGWKCDGGTVKYGLLFRGGEPTLADRPVLVDELGVRHDVNLRGAEGSATSSPLGSDIHFTKASTYNWYTLSDTEAWKTNLQVIFSAVTHNEPVFFHCHAGADRTGTVACILEGLLGMSQGDVDKDYELTCFWSGTATEASARRRNEDEWRGLISEISKKEGSTFADKCATFCAEIGFTAAQINAFRRAMIDGTPGELLPTVRECTISKSLENVTLDNTNKNVMQYQQYLCCAVPETGYVISEIKIVMDGDEITASVWNGDDTVLRRAVAAVIENATLSNTKTYVADGESYATEIIPSSEYTLENAEISLIMGGIEVSQYYKNGVIAIPRVTGDIQITIKAVPSASEHENQIPKSTVPGSSAIYNSVGYMANSRYGSQLTAKATEPGTRGSLMTVGVIPVATGKKIRLQNCWIDQSAATEAEYGGSAGGCNCGWYKDPAGTSAYYSASNWTNITNIAEDVMRDSRGYIVGWSFGSDIDSNSVKGMTFTLATNDASKAVIYYEE